MQFTASQIGFMLNGTVEGDASVIVERLAKIEEGELGCISFLANPKYEGHLYTTRASVVIVNNNQVVNGPVNATLIRVENAYTAFASLLNQYQSIRLNKTGIEQPSYIHETAKVGRDTYIGAFAYIGPNVKIGDNCKIYPHVYIADNVSLGNNVTLFPGVAVYFDCILGTNVTVHSGTIIGADGFGFAPNADGSYTKVSQTGNVVIEDDVEIGSNTTIDRATLGSTIIRKGAKLDNLIQIGHNAEIGANTVIAAQSGISGSTKVGERVMMGGQVGVVGHISIADGTQIQAQSGINKALKEENARWMGTPVMKYGDHMRTQVVLQRLPELEKRIAELEKFIKDASPQPLSKQEGLLS